MIAQLLSVITVSLTLLTLIYAYPSHAADTVVAEVGSVPVTIYDLGREQQRIIPFNATFHSGVPADTMEKIKTEALNAVTDRAYKVNYALSKKIKIDKSIIDDRIKALQKKYKDEKEFNAALGGESLKELRAAIERSLLAQKAEEIAITNNINVTEADVKAYYETNKKMYNRPKQFKASHILIKVNPSANSEERVALEKKANDLLKKAKSGDDFYNLAYYNSDDRSKYVGGDLGYFHEGQTVPEFEAALKKLKIGEVSNLVKTMYGWHIIKLTDVNEPKQLDYDETKAKIREQLEKTEKDRLYNNWMTELKNLYSVKKH